jgi:sugar phosphate isomerase/epimerase
MGPVREQAPAVLKALRADSGGILEAMPMRDFLISRRSLLAGAAMLARAADEPRPTTKVAIFSKHLQFLQGEELARAAAEIGYDGIDITVRKGGHVEPERVRQNLPELVRIIRAQGLEVPMITTDIVDADTPFAEDMVATAAGLGILHYRFGGFQYTGEPYPRQLAAFRPRVAKLAAINAKYRSCAMYHTHSGAGVVGASIWDLHAIMQDIDPAQVGVNFDVAHATIEGGLGGWINSFRITGSYLRGIAVKDFAWGVDAKGVWQPQWRPLGEGMVHVAEFLQMVKTTGFHGPLQQHFEYALGGANDGKAQITIPRAEVFSAMKRDLTTLRGQLSRSGL